MNISTLMPKEVWSNFYQLTQIPRPSGGEQRVVEWLKGFAVENDLEWMVDEVGNIRISAAASEGCREGEKRGVITLQAHLDMVCEKRSDSQHDFEHDPIDCYIEDGWVRARGTTLGADCGIGVAAALAALTDRDLRHGGIDALFTVDEERGLTGAFGLGSDMIRGDLLLNLDSEDEGEVFIGCAGGIDSVAELAYQRDETVRDALLWRVSVGGLQGGHSGDDIDKGRANAVKILTEIISWCGGVCRIVDLEAGNLRNAIPREGWVDLLVERSYEYLFMERFEGVRASMEGYYADREPNIDISLSRSKSKKIYPIDSVSQSLLLLSLGGVVNGVISMSKDIEGLVETSSNLASVRCEDGFFRIVTSQRSSTLEGRDDAMGDVSGCFEAVGASVTHSDGYPGWSPNPESKLLKIAQRCYADLFGEDLKVRAIHAGLECGLFLERNPDLDMISFGPTMRGVHSPDERLEIASVERFWRFLKSIIERV